MHSDISLVITGGLRVSADFAKALVMGADAVAVASAGLIAAACQHDLNERRWKNVKFK